MLLYYCFFNECNEIFVDKIKKHVLKNIKDFQFLSKDPKLYILEMKLTRP